MVTYRSRGYPTKAGIKWDTMERRYNGECITRYVHFWLELHFQVLSRKVKRNHEFLSFSCRIVPWHYERCIQKWRVEFNSLLMDWCSPVSLGFRSTQVWGPQAPGSSLGPQGVDPKGRPSRISGALGPLDCFTNGNAPGSEKTGHLRPQFSCVAAFINAVGTTV